MKDDSIKRKGVRWETQGSKGEQMPTGYMRNKYIRHKFPSVRILYGSIKVFICQH